MRHARLGAWLLAFLSALLAAAYALTAVGVARSVIDWRPTSTEAPTVPLDLSAESPETLTMSVPCSAAARSVGRVFSTDVASASGFGLVVESQGSHVWLTVEGRAQPATRLALGPGAGCVVSLVYERSTATATLKVSDPESSGSAAFIDPADPQDAGSVKHLVVNALSANRAAIPEIEARIVTQPSRFDSPAWRWLLALAAVATALGALALAALSGRNNGAVGSAREGSAREGARWSEGALSLPDAAVALALGVGLIVVPPTFDDGWVLTTVRAFPDIGFFSNYFSVQASPQPQGFWWSWLGHLWLGPLGTPGFLLRLPACLLVLLAWWLLRRRVIDELFRTHRCTARWAAAVIYTATSVSFLISLRPEPMITLLIAATLSLVVRYQRRTDPWVLAALGAMCALAMATHQTGWSVVGATVAAAPLAWAWARSVGTRVATATVAPMVVATGVLFLTLSMLGSNLTLWTRAVTAFADDSLSYSRLLREDHRLSQLVNSFTTGPGRLLTVGLLAILIVGFLTRHDRSANPSRILGRAAIASAAGLLLTSSKLPDHLGVLAVPMACLAALVMVDMRSRVVAGDRPLARMALIAGAGLAAGWVATNPLFTGPRNTDLVTDRPVLEDQVPVVGFSVSMPLFWLVLAAAAAAIGWILGRRRDSGALGAFHGVALALVVTCIAAGLWPGVAQAGNPASWVGQQLAALNGQTCGLAGPAGSPIPTSWEALPIAAPSEDSIAVARTRPDDANGPARPVPGVEILTARFDVAGVAASPWYAISPRDELAAWTLSGFQQYRYALEYRSGDGQALPAQDVIRSAASLVWQRVSLKAPEGARQVRLRWFSTDGPLSATSVVRVSATSTLREAAGSSPVWVNPGNYLQAPCLQAPSIAGGVYRIGDWSFGLPMWNGTLPGQSLTEYACPTDATARDLVCTARIQQAASEGLTVESVYEDVR